MRLRGLAVCGYFTGHKCVGWTLYPNSFFDSPPTASAQTDLLKLGLDRRGGAE